MPYNFLKAFIVDIDADNIVTVVSVLLKSLFGNMNLLIKPQPAVGFCPDGVRGRILS